MNKEKLIEKMVKMKNLAKKQTMEHPCDRLDEIANDIATGYITAIDELNDFIQSEPEETCDGCIYEKEPVDTYPCKHCKRAYTDSYEKAGE